MYVHHVLHMESLIVYYGKAHSTVEMMLSLCLSRSWVSKRSRLLVADVQVVSCHCYLVIFHLFVK